MVKKGAKQSEMLEKVSNKFFLTWDFIVCDSDSDSDSDSVSDSDSDSQPV